MTLKLTERDTRALSWKLADILARAEVSSNRFLDHRIFSELNELEGRVQEKESPLIIYFSVCR